MRLWVRVRVRLCLCVRPGLCACAFVRSAVHPRTRHQSPLAPCSVLHLVFRLDGPQPRRRRMASVCSFFLFFVRLLPVLFRLVAGIGEYSHKKKAAFWRELVALFPHLIDFLCSCVAGRVCSPCFFLSRGVPSCDRPWRSLRCPSLRRPPARPGSSGLLFPSRRSRPARPRLFARVPCHASARELGQPQLVLGLDRFYREFISSPDDRPDIEVRPVCTHGVLTGYSQGTYGVHMGCLRGAYGVLTGYVWGAYVVLTGYVRVTYGVLTGNGYRVPAQHCTGLPHAGRRKHGHAAYARAHAHARTHARTHERTHVKRNPKALQVAHAKVNTELFSWVREEYRGQV
jgi:hypothetical protein